MSSKFSKPWGVQKPPAVCYPPPADYPPIPVPFGEQFFQGWCEWNQYGLSGQLAITGPMEMAPVPLSQKHVGVIPSDDYQLQLTMQAFPPTSLLTFHAQLSHLGAPIADFTSPPAPPQTASPFDSGYIEVTDQPGTMRVVARVWL